MHNCSLQQNHGSVAVQALEFLSFGENFLPLDCLLVFPTAGITPKFIVSGKQSWFPRNNSSDAACSLVKRCAPFNNDAPTPHSHPRLGTKFLPLGQSAEYQYSTSTVSFAKAANQSSKFSLTQFL
eukprot:EG_transcript_36085